MNSYVHSQTFPSIPLILAVARDLTAALAAVAQGATAIDLWEAGPEAADAIRAHHPADATCAQADWAGLVRDLATAQRTGAVLIRTGLTEAEEAEEAGIGRDRMLVEAPPSGTAQLLAGGWPVLVAADEAAGPHAAAAAAAMACWLGAAAIRTSHITAVRRAIDMTAAIMGTNGHPAAADRQRNGGPGGSLGLL